MMEPSWFWKELIRPYRESLERSKIEKQKETNMSNSLVYLIETLKNTLAKKGDITVKIGFHNPHSYRGYYEDLAFEPKVNASLKEMLACAEEALGTTYDGYKGGEYTMDHCTHVWISEWGRADGQSISTILLAYMLDDFTIFKGEG